MNSQDPIPSVLHVARKAAELLDFNVTPLKLQKLTYYCQAWSLAWRGRPIFEDDFQAWANGPVAPALYIRHRGQYAIDSDFLRDSSEFAFNDEDNRTIGIVLAFYGNKTPQFLSELTHMEQPWKQARGNTPLGEPSTATISKESMQEYYTGISSLK